MRPDDIHEDAVHPLPSGHDRIAERVWALMRSYGCLGRPETVPGWHAD
jgi:hypothetical protein